MMALLRFIFLQSRSIGVRVLNRYTTRKHACWRNTYFTSWNRFDFKWAITSSWRSCSGCHSIPKVQLNKIRRCLQCEKKTHLASDPKFCPFVFMTRRFKNLVNILTKHHFFRGSSGSFSFAFFPMICLKNSRVVQILLWPGFGKTGDILWPHWFSSEDGEKIVAKESTKRATHLRYVSTWSVVRTNKS